MNTCIREVTVPTSIRLDDEVEARLQFLSKKTGRTKAYYLRELVTRGLQDLEDYYLGMDVIERIRKAEDDVFTAAEVRKELGLDN